MIVQAYLLMANPMLTPLPRGAKPLDVGVMEKIVNGSPWAGPHVICACEEGNVIVNHRFVSVPLGKTFPDGVKAEDAEYVGTLNLDNIVFSVFYLGEVT